jgi:hypothetical protein
MRAIYILLFASINLLAFGQESKKLDSVLIFSYPDIGKKDSILTNKILPSYSNDLQMNKTTYSFDGENWLIKTRISFEYDSLGRKLSTKWEKYLSGKQKFKPLKKDSISFDGDSIVKYFARRDYEDGFGKPESYTEVKYDSKGRVIWTKGFRLSSNGKAYNLTGIDSLITETFGNKRFIYNKVYGLDGEKYKLYSVTTKYQDITKQYQDKLDSHVIGGEVYHYHEDVNNQILICEKYLVNGKKRTKRDSFVYHMRDSLKYDSFKRYSILRNHSYDTVYFIYSLHFDWAGNNCRSIKSKGYFQEFHWHFETYPSSKTRKDTTFYQRDMYDLVPWKKSSHHYHADGREKLKKFFRYDWSSDSFRVQYKHYYIYDTPTSTFQNQECKLTAFPNPSSGLVNFNTCDKSGFSIYDINGRLILTRNEEETTQYFFDKPGVYFIRSASGFKKVVITN